MATSLAQAGVHQTQLPPSRPNYFENYYNLAHQQPLTIQGTPSSSSSTASPTSPPRWFPQHLQQSHCSRQQKSPLYVPAVLRAPERPTRPTQHKRVESLKSIISPSPTSTGFGSQGRDASDATSLGAPHEGISRIVTEEWADDSASCQVTGAPTRNHWKPDSAAPVCSSTPCSRPFSFLLRRHHCRRCGGIFCSDHSPYTVPLDQHARFHPRGTRQRACDNCHADFNLWSAARQERLGSRAGSVTSSDGTLQDDRRVPGRFDTPMSSTPTSPLIAVAMPQPAGNKTDTTQVVGSFTGSVPPQWQWSTF